MLRDYRSSLLILAILALIFFALLLPPRLLYGMSLMLLLLRHLRHGDDDDIGRHNEGTSSSLRFHFHTKCHYYAFAAMFDTLLPPPCRAIRLHAYAE